jgi:flagellar protein FlaG
MNDITSVSSQIGQEQRTEPVQRPQQTPEQRRQSERSARSQELQRQQEALPDKAREHTRPEQGKGTDGRMLDRDKMEEIRENLNEALEKINIGLSFDQHEETGETVVKVMNRATDEVIRQIPPEAMLEMARRIEDMTGMLVDVWR